MLLITGATGFIGSHLVEAVCAARRPVRCLVRRRSATSRLPASAQIAIGDLLSGEGLPAALEGVECVVHLAGVTKALRPAGYYAGNAGATGKLMAALAGHAARLVHVSSLAAVGPSPDGRPLDEEAAPAPVSHYGKSKLAAERLARSRLGTVIVRPPVVYGPRDTDVFQLIRSIDRGLVLEIAGAERWFSAIYVHDLVAGLLRAVDDAAAAGRTYFLTHPRALTWKQFGAAAAAVLGRRPRTVRVSYGAARAVGWAAEMQARLTGRPGILSRDKVAEARCTHWICSADRATRELGFMACTSIEQGLSATIAWYQEAGWLK